MAEKLDLDSEVHELVLGKSFDKSAPIAFHSLRYDFKSASADTSQASCVDIGEGNSVTVQVPNMEGSGASHTLYKGNKRPTQKECVLIIDHDTGQITLERLATNITLKKASNRGMQNKNKGLSEGLSCPRNNQGAVFKTMVSGELAESKTTSGGTKPHVYCCNVLKMYNNQKTCSRLAHTTYKTSNTKSSVDENPYASLISFARSSKDDIVLYLNSLKGASCRRPYVTSKYGLGQFQAEHPELYERAVRRTHMDDSDIDELNSFFCSELGSYFLGVDVYNRLQLLEDATDFILNKYFERYLSC